MRINTEDFSTKEPISNVNNLTRILLSKTSNDVLAISVQEYIDILENLETLLEPAMQKCSNQVSLGCMLLDLRGSKRKKRLL